MGQPQLTHTHTVTESAGFGLQKFEEWKESSFWVGVLTNRYGSSFTQKTSWKKYGPSPVEVGSFSPLFIGLGYISSGAEFQPTRVDKGESLVAMRLFPWQRTYWSRAAGQEVELPKQLSKAQERIHMGVSKNGENLQNGWFIMENPIFNGWFGGKTHYFWKHLYDKIDVSPLRPRLKRSWILMMMGSDADICYGNGTDPILCWNSSTGASVKFKQKLHSPVHLQQISACGQQKFGKNQESRFAHT